MTCDNFHHIQDVLQHLRSEHGKAESDEDLMRLVQVPYDSRRVYCHACLKDENRSFEWCCQQLRDIEDDLVEHRNAFHKTQTVRS